MLATFVRENREAILSRWEAMAVERLGLENEQRPQLVNDLPDFLGEIAGCLEQAPADWPPAESARAHGEQRVGLGVDIGGLAEEFALVAEAILLTAERQGVRIPLRDTALLSRIVGRGAAASVREYARLRDRELAAAADEHVSFVAHELRTPLQTARLALLYLSLQRTDDSGSIERIRCAHDELAELIDNSLVKARLTRDLVLRPTRFEVRDLVQEALRQVELAAGRREMRLDAHVEDVTIDGDRRLLRSALTNLLTNAVKFSEKGATVEVRVSAREERILIEVADACGGMPEDLPPRLFQPFVQGREDTGGSGLGLLIVKQAIEAHGGAVRICNRPGSGCTFVIELARRRASAPE